MAADISERIAICHNCPLKKLVGFDLFCVAKAEPVKVWGRALAGKCPNGHFDGEPLPPPGLAGDIAEAAMKRIGADRLAKWWSKVTGKPCGCADRKEWMNRLHARLRKKFGVV